MNGWVVGVTLYSSGENGLPTEPIRRKVTPAQRRWRWGSALVAGCVLLTVALSATPAPYVIEMPGPTFNTLGTVSVNVEGVTKKQKLPLITIDGATTYRTDGNLNLLTVNVLGSPESLPSWGDIIFAWFDRSRAVIPVDAVYPPEVSVEDQEQESASLMVNSQQDAIAAALSHEGYDVVSGIQVLAFAEGSPANSVLKENDVIVSIDGFAPKSVQQLRDRLSAVGAGNQTTLQVRRDGELIDVLASPYLNDDGDTVLGIGAMAEYQFPFEVVIRLDDVGGPSAGMMFALGIIDKITPGNLNGGLNISGTGTIDSDGFVGPIGGIRQKMFGAVGAESPFFLAPEGNCDEVIGHVPDNLAVFATGTLDESLRILEYLKTHQDPITAVANAEAAGIRTCETVMSSARG